MGSDLGVYNVGYIITWLPSRPLNQPPSLALLSSVSLNVFFGSFKYFSVSIS